MRKTTFTILFFVVLFLKGSNATLRVHPDSPECETQGTFLKCDFQGSADENAILETLPQRSINQIRMIHIHNIKKLIITRVLCEDVSFYNVESIGFSNNNLCDNKVPSLRFVDSKAESVPRQVNRLEITRSHIDKITCNEGLQKLQIIDSYVGELYAAWTVAGDFTVRIEDSTIDKLKALRIESRVFLVMRNATINLAFPGSLILGKDSITHITESVITSETNAVVIKNGAKLILTATSGKINILGSVAGKHDDKTRRPPGVPQKNTMTPPSDGDEAYVLNVPPSCASTPMWVWIAPTVLASLEGIILIVMCGQKIPNKKSILKNDTEYGDNFNVRVDTSRTEINPTSIYNEYSNVPTVVRRR